MIQQDRAAPRTNLASGDRFSEIAEILACGLARLMNRKSSQVSEVNRENPLYFSSFQSVGRPVPLNGERP